MPHTLWAIEKKVKALVDYEAIENLFKPKIK